MGAVARRQRLQVRGLPAEMLAAGEAGCEGRQEGE
jgi:hypothetical protein